MFSILWGLYLWVELLDQLISPYLALYGTCQTVLQNDGTIFAFLPAIYEAVNLSIFYPTFFSVSFLF